MLAAIFLLRVVDRNDDVAGLRHLWNPPIVCYRPLILRVHIEGVLDVDLV